ncbi:aldo/keto reductase [Nocardioides marmoraquaticus]
MATVPNLTLNDGRSIPQLGFGVFQIPPDETAKLTGQAFEAGYRHIDTAQMYGNEKGVGDAVAASGLGRDDLWITTKLNNGFHEPDVAKKSLHESLEKLGLDFVDLFLIHWPLPTRYDGDYVSTWQALIDLQAEGLTKSIGVSNFQPAHLARIGQETSVTPAVNQIEVHPYFANEDARSASLGQDTLVEAWSPIAQGGVLKDEVISAIASDVERTTAQVTLRWHVQRGDIIFPKSSSPERMAENFAIFDFELTDDQMGRINELDQGEDGRTGPNPDEFDMIPD